MLPSCCRCSAQPHRDERGASATEYGLLVIFIAIAITIGVGLFGGAVNALFGGLANDVAAFF